MTLLEAKGVSKVFGGLVAVNQVSLSVARGEIVGLIGPNGAGKTTLFQVLSGFYAPDGGDVWFKGESIVGLKPHEICKRGMTRTFQIVKPFPDLTVFDNVLTGAFNTHRDVAGARRKAAEVLDLLDFSARACDLAGALPVAGRKRLELARVLATEPELILLDEVMAGLTPAEMKDIIETIRRIREGGMTLVIIEHVMAAIMNLCDRIYVLHHGETIAEGPPREVAHDPAVVKAYLGDEFSL